MKPDPLDDIQRVAGVGPIVNLDQIANGDLKDIYVRLLAWAYSRIYVNSKLEGSERWQNIFVWICMNDARTAKAITTENRIHVVINDGLVEQIIWDAYRIGHNPDMFPWINGAGGAERNKSYCDMTAVSPADLLRDIRLYRIDDERRHSLIMMLLALSFLFVIDHEYCHLAHHHAFLEEVTRSGDLSPVEIDFLTMQALEHDSDVFATNRWVDMLIGRDYFLDHCEFAPATAALREQDRSTKYVLFTYAIFCGFRGMGQENWAANFPSTGCHPPAPFRFKSILACLYSRLEKLDPIEMNAFETLGSIIWTFLEFLYAGGSATPSIRKALEIRNTLEDVSSIGADTHFRALYGRWRELVLSAKISGWEGIVPPEY